MARLGGAGQGNIRHLSSFPAARLGGDGGGFDRCARLVWNQYPGFREWPLPAIIDRIFVQKMDQNPSENLLEKYLHETAAEAIVAVGDEGPEDIVSWAEKNFYIPERWDKRVGSWVTWEGPIRLEEHQKILLRYIMGLVLSNEINTIVYSCVKKSGKTTTGSLVAQFWAEQMQPYNDILVCANDLEQAVSRIFETLKDSIDISGRGGPPGKTAGKDYEVPKRDPRITYLPKKTVIQAIPTDYRGEAGANMGLSCYSELWGFGSENARRLWAELTPVPTKRYSVRFVETYAGFLNESELLWDIYNATVKSKYRLDDPILEGLPCYRRGSTFVYWDHEPRMPWQTPKYYQDQRTELRPMDYKRLHENRWVRKESAFVNMELWDMVEAAGVERWKPGDETPLVLAVDASQKKDRTALVCCTYDAERDRVLIKHHRIWEPRFDQDMGERIVDLEQTVKREILRLKEEGANIVAIYYDPWQFHSIAVSLLRSGYNMVEFPQTEKRVLADQHLYDRIMDGSLEGYKAPDLRKHIENAVAITSGRGLRLMKSKATQYMDAAVSLSMAAYGAVNYLAEGSDTGGVGIIF